MNGSPLRGPVGLLAAEIGAGAQITGCRAGPRALLPGVHDTLREEGVACRSYGIVSSREEAGADKLAIVNEFLPRLAAAVRRMLADDAFPLVLGGDHSCAAGTWSAIAEAVRARGTPGLIWIDAHLDSHTPQTSASQAPHGMPLAALLGEGDAGMSALYGWRGKVRPQHVTVIGARSHEAEETARLQRLGVRVFAQREVARRGFARCLAEARTLAGAAPAGYGVSFDLDVIDPRDAPGVGSPAEDGLRPAEAVEALAALADDRALLGLELVEYNPALDVAGRTARLAEALLSAALAGRREAVEAA